MPDLTPVFHAAAPQTLAALSRRAGLPLTSAQAELLLVHQEQTLLDLGRVDFAGGILPKLIAAFADSPYILAEDWAEALARLTELFYAFKFETRDAIADDALLVSMRRMLDGPCGGSLDALANCRARDFFALLTKEDHHE